MDKYMGRKEAGLAQSSSQSWSSGFHNSIISLNP